MAGYLSIFGLLGLAVFCTDGGDAYTNSATCQEIGLPLLTKLDRAGATAAFALDHKTLVPLLVAFGPVSAGNLPALPLHFWFTFPFLKCEMYRLLTNGIIVWAGNLGLDLQWLPRRSALSVLAFPQRSDISHRLPLHDG